MIHIKKIQNARKYDGLKMAGPPKDYSPVSNSRTPEHVVD